MYNENNYYQKEYVVDYDRVYNMVIYIFLEIILIIIDEVDNVEEFNFDVKRFYEMLDVMNQLLYIRCRKGFFKWFLVVNDICMVKKNELDELLFELDELKFKKNGLMIREKIKIFLDEFIMSCLIELNIQTSCTS